LKTQGKKKPAGAYPGWKSKAKKSQPERIPAGKVKGLRLGVNGLRNIAPVYSFL